MKNNFSGWGVHFNVVPPAFHKVGFSETELGWVFICDFISSEIPRAEMVFVSVRGQKISAAGSSSLYPSVPLKEKIKYGKS